MMFAGLLEFQIIKLTCVNFVFDCLGFRNLLRLPSVELGFGFQFLCV